MSEEERRERKIDVRFANAILRRSKTFHSCMDLVFSDPVQLQFSLIGDEMFT